ncbi:hypothetical protein [Streptomyces sp. NBC_01618]|uniref:hypothetical protein n=1 Tax=Streptomyces sp. NBC_01618 TaxID=2975900 RepID=UPI003869469D|nr:hypothetical protein OH735_28760 [Streptomyces sp. NBC_01618]
MRHAHVNAAKFISRDLGEPYDELLGGEEAHHLLATAHADRVCPPTGHRISWEDCYASADLYPLTWKALLLLDMRGAALPPTEHLTGDDRQRAVAAGDLAEWITREARTFLIA